MRIADSMTFATAVARLDATQSSVSQDEEIAGSGLSINQPSDDPTGWSEVSSLNERITVMKARSAGATAVAGDLSMAESALASASDLLVTAKSVALSMANGTASPSDRQNAAAQIGSLRSQILALANTQGAGGYLFGGNATQNPPFDTSGKYVGDLATRTVQISETLTAPANADGAAAFTSAYGGRDVLADLAQLQADLQGNNVAGITADVGSVTTDNDQIITARVQTGLRASTLTNAASTMSSTVDSLTTLSSSIADADAPSAYSNLVASQQSYEAALAVSQRVLAMSSMVQGQ